MKQILTNTFTVAPAGARPPVIPSGLLSVQANAQSSRLANYLARAATKNGAILSVSSISARPPHNIMGKDGQ